MYLCPQPQEFFDLMLARSSKKAAVHRGLRFFRLNEGTPQEYVVIEVMPSSNEFWDDVAALAKSFDDV